MNSKKSITIATIVLLILFVYYSINAAPLVSDKNYTYLSNMEWYNTYEEGRKAAIAENKPILLYTWAIWCIYCEKMQTQVYPTPEISKILQEEFVRVAVDLDVNRNDANRFGIQYPPYELFLTPQGEVITRVPGYLPAEQFLPLLQSVRDFYYGGKGARIQVEKDLPQTTLRK